MQNLGFVGMTVGMLILLFATLQQGGPAQHAPLVLVGFILFNLLMNLGPNATTFTMPPELFPTQMRASASGFAGSVAKLGATVGIFFLPALKADFGIPAVLGLMAIVSLLGLGVTLFFGEEVDREKSLEEHQQ